jgi:hypothetical protein
MTFYLILFLPSQTKQPTEAVTFLTLIPEVRDLNQTILIEILRGSPQLLQAVVWDIILNYAMRISFLPVH